MNTDDDKWRPRSLNPQPIRVGLATALAAAELHALELSIKAAGSNRKGRRAAAADARRTRRRAARHVRKAKS